jgi:hypothetical protein
MGAFTLISVTPRESVAFSFKISNLSLKSFALLFSVFYVSLPSMQLAKQETTGCLTTTVMTQASALVAQLVAGLS